MLHLVPVRLFVPILAASFVATSACAGLKYAEEDDAGVPEESDDSGAGPGEAGDVDAGSKADGPSNPPSFASYDDAQKGLLAHRYPGPVTAPGSTGRCTANHFVWRDQNGAIHRWSPGASSKPQLDYGFTTPVNRPLFVPSDDFIVVDAPGSASLSVYNANGATALVASLPYAFHFVASAGSIIRADQAIDGGQLGGTKVRRWFSSNGAVTDVSQLLATTQPPEAFENDELVIPGAVPIPHPLYIVNVTKKTTASVVFDGALASRMMVPSPHGLFVSYARSGGASALRLYRGNRDDTSSRFELGDELANRAPVFADSPPDEHRFLARLAVYGRTVLYDSAFGIWAHDLEAKSLAPVQLGPSKKAFLTDVLCVIPAQGLLAYRILDDTVGQVWFVRLGNIGIRP